MDRQTDSDRERWTGKQTERNIEIYLNKALAKILAQN